MDKDKPRKRGGRTATGVSLPCECGAKPMVLALEKGFMAHCAACGTLTFFKNADLLERLRYGAPLCHHKPERKLCPAGHTTWCVICRVRTFYRDSVPG